VWIRKNTSKLSLCDADLSPELSTMVLRFYNHDWDLPDWYHWCLPGCCEDSDEKSSERGYEILSAATCKFADTPLLYRWKHFEPASSHALRGLYLHGVLPRTFAMTLDKLKVPENVEDLEVQVRAAENLGDEPYALRGQVRQRKSGTFYSHPETRTVSNEQASGCSAPAHHARRTISRKQTGIPHEKTIPAKNTLTDGEGGIQRGESM